LTKVPNTLSARQARRYAGYETNEQMDEDLDKRERELKDKMETDSAWKMLREAA
jgi:non-canonical poly(A) RNA polymerase PAPD5/7